MSTPNLAAAEAVYSTFRKVLDDMQVIYTEHKEDNVITFGYKGKDMNHDIIIFVNPESETFRIVERLPYDIPEDKIIDVALAASLVNSRLMIGGFTYALDEHLNFEVAQSYAGSLVGEAAIKKCLFAVFVCVEEYDDKFMALNKGYITIKEFMQE